MGKTHWLDFAATQWINLSFGSKIFLISTFAKMVHITLLTEQIDYISGMKAESKLYEFVKLLSRVGR